MKLAVIGSERFNKYEYMSLVLDKHPCTVLISAEERDFGFLVHRYAKEKKLIEIVYPPKKKIHGKKDSFIRHELIIKECDELVAFWDGKSAEIKHAIHFIKDMNKHSYVYLI